MALWIIDPAGGPCAVSSSPSPSIILSIWWMTSTGRAGSPTRVDVLSPGASDGWDLEG